MFAIGITFLISGGALLAPYYLFHQLSIPVEANFAKTGLQLFYLGLITLFLSLILLATALAMGLFEWLTTGYDYF